jgi:hypothetical protein
MNFEKPRNLEKKKEDRFTWRDNLKKAFKLSAVPVLFSAFLASCGDKPPSDEVLKNFRENHDTATLSVEKISAIDSLINKAKAEGKTHFLLKDTTYNEQTEVSVDTVANILHIKHDVNGNPDNVVVSDIKKDKTIDFMQQLGTGNTVILAQMQADAKTGVVLKAYSTREGEYSYEGYGIDKAGKTIGDKKVAEDVIKYNFANTLRDVETVMSQGK